MSMLAPGSRSTPLALALATGPNCACTCSTTSGRPRSRRWGSGSSSERPALVVSTSGTAAAEMHAAVVEAHQAEVPLVLCTADRPPELREVAAPQTIDQIGLYGAAVRFAADPGAPDEAMAPRWRSMVSRALADAAGPLAGPGPPQPALPRSPRRRRRMGCHRAGRTARHGTAWLRAVGCSIPRLSTRWPAGLDQPARRDRRRRRGGRPGGRARRWPPRPAGRCWPTPGPAAGCPRPHTVAAFDDLLRHPGFAADHTPTRRAPPRSPTGLEGAGPMAGGLGRRPGAGDGVGGLGRPEGTAGQRLVADPTALCAATWPSSSSAGARTPWPARWRRAEERAQAGHRRRCSPMPDGPTEPGVARALVGGPAGRRRRSWRRRPCRSATSSGTRRRGTGCATWPTGAPTASTASCPPPSAWRWRRPPRRRCSIGDVALLHDSNGLLGLRPRAADLTIVVVDNDGGGIFSFLPRRRRSSADRFEQLFGTPHGVDLDGPGRRPRAALGGRRATCGDLAELVGDGPRLLRVGTDRADNVAVHQAIHDAVVAAPRPAPEPPRSCPRRDEAGMLAIGRCARLRCPARVRTGRISWMGWSGSPRTSCVASTLIPGLRPGLLVRGDARCRRPAVAPGPRRGAGTTGATPVPADSGVGPPGGLRHGRHARVAGRGRRHRRPRLPGLGPQGSQAARHGRVLGVLQVAPHGRGQQPDAHGVHGALRLWQQHGDVDRLPQHPDQARPADPERRPARHVRCRPVACASPTTMPSSCSTGRRRERRSTSSTRSGRVPPAKASAFPTGAASDDADRTAHVDAPAARRTTAQ